MKKSEWSRSQMFFKIDVLKNFAIFTLLKRDSNTGVFFCDLQNFEEQFFYRTPPVAASGLEAAFFSYHKIKRCTLLKTKNKWIVHKNFRVCSISFSDCSLKATGIFHKLVSYKKLVSYMSNAKWHSSQSTSLTHLNY